MPTLNIVTLIILAAGAILIYSAITDRNPVEVVKNALKGKAAPTGYTKSGFSSDAKTGEGNSSSGGGSF